MDLTERITTHIDGLLEREGRTDIGAVEAAASLDRAGILPEDTHRPGRNLRQLLRNGDIPHAYQPGGKKSRWIIPHSQGEKEPKRQRQRSVTVPAPRADDGEAADATEQLRNSYRPEHIQVLFIGESPPAGGTFFYHGNSRLFHETRQAFASLGYETSTPQEFLRNFQQSGLYLDDLCHSPVDNLTLPERRRRWEKERPHLAERLQTLNPESIVVVMKKIVPQVKQSAIEADLSQVPLYELPFPTYGNQRAYREQLARILPKLLDHPF